MKKNSMHQQTQAASTHPREARASIIWGPLRPILYWMVILGSTRSPCFLIRS